mmetsp:Transcript_7351/g.17927  ORF Transcript_7351/g.17927 Transcript_7351/m.17927 type:complete len:734 (-) Transcript_7351:104-2305(-)
MWRLRWQQLAAASRFPSSHARRFLSGATGPPQFQTECGLYVDKSLPATFSKILIANRGEIACRVMRTAKALGVKTVAVFSDADAHAEHVRMADEAYRIGEPPAAQSYLLSDKILEVAKLTGSEAIHPGYGFLSENEKFAEACAAHGVKFIGPPSSAIRDMGSKSASKIIMTNANVPVVPGYHGEDQSEAKLVEEAKKIGYPLMIKAVLGGGGKGMRIVRSHDEFLDMLDSAKRESMKSFKDDNVLLERYITRPRHIEFQVFADQHGDAVHLFERDCSVQRRHQKILEEAPAPGMSHELRQKMGQSAVDAAKAVGYEGAGTVEFIFDAETDEYFFMEMNTRLQVEHPVSEMITRRDLVQWQLHVAKGFPLPTNQEAINDSVAGHALEARIYAEDPDNGFLPAVGKLHHVKYPLVDGNTRVETGIQTGDEVSIFYDPMIAKLIVLGRDRADALAKCDTALQELQIVGCPTNIKFLRKCVQHPDFIKGGVETGFIEQNMDDLFPKEDPEESAQKAAVASAIVGYALVEDALVKGEKSSKASADSNSPWSQRTHMRVNSPVPSRIDLLLKASSKDEPTPMTIEALYAGDQKGGRTVVVASGGRDITVKGLHPFGSENMMLMVDDVLYKPDIAANGNEMHLFFGDQSVCFELPTANFLGGDAEAGNGCVAPMAGKVVKVLAEKGQAFAKGDQLIILEAMKMEHVVKAPRDGTVKDIFCGEGDFVEGKKMVISFDPLEE